ncbi:type II toxin-antitoxin system RelE/ParE family toxin [Humisphaera borealis]|uniref:Type II toxin-antitoxin system RelE/ParE family toxin n=1 Tax=Humisphaera borealis TaxID=2807512 RepID=A0A7M2WTZ8_9BACT|nr:type II toxin-antitoxin system RelE/ParE family toxin [Humisphaera borealis]QOV88956.1 type II toxin-antitoxin system RelE/ParE family toxin [Humisphaera borealis]
MTTRKVRLAATAKRDIEHALDWSLENFGEVQHDIYLGLIKDALSAIERDPTAPPARLRPELRKGIWTRHIGRRGHNARHLFVYRIKRNGDVDIARFLHDAMDITRHIPKS